MRNLPTVTKNLLLANIIVFFIDALMKRYGLTLVNLAGLHYITAAGFKVWQPFTYMFLHANFTHIFCNMFAVLMFGPALEQEWGGRKFLIYYLVCGLGAAAFQEGVWAIMLYEQAAGVSPDVLAVWSNHMVTIGASGAVFGILFAFGWLFPDIPMFILFIPIPVRARTLVIIYAAIELFAGLAHVSGATPGDNVAHFAHLGGLIFGWLLILWWKHGGDEKLKRLFHRHNDDDDRGRFSAYHYHRNVEK